MSAGLIGGTQNQQQVGNTNQTSNGTTTRNINPLLQSAMNAASSNLNSALNGNPQYTKQQAIIDATNAANYGMTQMFTNNLPGINSAAKAAGGYNSTEQQQLTDNLAGQVTSAGAQTILNNIANYAGITNQNIASAATGLGAQTGAAVGSAGSTTTGATNQNTSQSANIQKIGGSTGTVICTQLFKDGHITWNEYLEDCNYVDARYSEATKNGYRFWAVPFVLAMRRNSTIYNLGKFLGLAWSRKCTGNSPLWLSAVAAIGVPICFIIGSIIPDVRYYKLWEGS